MKLAQPRGKCASYKFKYTPKYIHKRYTRGFFVITWRNCIVVFTESASNEMMDLYWDEGDVRQILEEGAERAGRCKGVCEIELLKGRKTRKVVAVESWQHCSKQLVWLVTHVGKTGRRKA